MDQPWTLTDSDDLTALVGLNRHRLLTVTFVEVPETSERCVLGSSSSAIRDHVHDPIAWRDARLPRRVVRRAIDEARAAGDTPPVTTSRIFGLTPLAQRRRDGRQAHAPVATDVALNAPHSSQWPRTQWRADGVSTIQR
jgi:hypothetical protein